MTADLAGLRVKVATACRVLARQELIDGILGHVSVRVDRNRLLVRCRGPRERGLLFTTPEEIRLLDFADEGDLGEYSPPNELPLHVETLRARPEVMSVVHAHPAAVVTVEQAVLRVINVDELARLSLEVVRCGGKPQDIPVEDLAELPDLGSGFNDRFLWQLHQARLRHEGLGR